MDKRYFYLSGHFCCQAYLREGPVDLHLGCQAYLSTNKVATGSGFVLYFLKEMKKRQ